MRISKKDYVRMIAKEAGLKYEVTEMVMKATAEVNKDILLNGFDLPIYGVGNIAVVVQNRKTPERRYNPVTKEYYKPEPQKPYNRIKLNTFKSFKDVLKEKTLGNPYVRD